MRRYARVVESNWNSTMDSTGLAHVIYFVGCYKRCKGCHNPELQSPTAGSLVNIQWLKQQIYKNKIATHLVFQGGEPFQQYQQMRELADYARVLDKEVWVYTGYDFSYLRTHAFERWGVTSWMELLEPFDVIIAGPYIQGLKSEDYTFLASSNQQAWVRDTKENTWFQITEDRLMNL